MGVDGPKRFTIGEYLAFERQSATKHDYFQGEIFEVSEADRRHHQLLENIATLLQAQLKGRDHEVQRHDLSSVAVLHGKDPVVIVKVLFPSPELFDRTAKLSPYTGVLSLREVLLVAQAKVHTEHYTREEGHDWLLREVDNSSFLEISALGCTLDLQRVYERVFD